MTTARVECISDLNQEILECARSDLEASGIDVTLHRSDPGPQGAMEWAMPAAVAFVFGTIAAGFLKEIGKDIYSGLKSTLRTVFIESKERPVNWYHLRDEPTLRPSNKRRQTEVIAQSPPLSISIQLGPMDRMIFVFSDNIAIDDFEEAFRQTEITYHSVMSYASLRNAGIHCKEVNPKYYYSTMPENMYQRHLTAEAHEISNIMSGIYLFDSHAKIWVKVHPLP